MTSPDKLLHQIHTVTLALLLCGCATLRTPRPDPLSIEEVVAMVENQMPDDDIIQKILDSHSVFYLDSEQILHLRNQGLSAILVDEMMQTGLNQQILDARRQERFDWMSRTPVPSHYRAYPYYYPYWYDPLYDPLPPKPFARSKSNQ